VLVVGSVTPPVGVLAMVASRIAGISYNASLAMLFPFTAAWMLMTILMAYVPQLVLWLSRLMQ
jgi:TRAP-type C4-dicarboxylate transport system permease large subunit